MKEVFERILAAGVMAPSADNCQPWRFVATPDHVDVHNVPEADESPYDWGQRPSYIAHGALLENMTIAASQQGYGTDISLFPDRHASTLVARVRIFPAGLPPDPLYGAIPDRATNRKPYANTPFTDQQRRDIQAAAQESQAHLVLVEDSAQRAALGRIAATNEIVLFGNRRLHSFFFGHLNWTPQEDAQKRSGMLIHSLEVPPPVRLLFRAFKRWNIMRYLDMLGFPKVIAMGNGKLYATGAATAAIVMDNRNPESFIAAGRTLQRVWLQAAASGLSLQPLTGIPILMNPLEAGDMHSFSPAHTKLIRGSYAEAANILGTGDRPIALLLRMGTADAPSVRTLRRAPDITW